MHMSTPEQIEFQLLRKDGEEPKAAVYPDGQEPLEQPDDAAKGVVGRKITSRWKKISLTLLTLLGYTFVYAAMSDVTAFYAILAQNHNVATYIAGFVLGVNSLCLASLAPVIGYILPHLGLKFTQVAGLFLTAGSQLLFGFVSKMPTPTLFIAFSFLLKAVEGIGLTMFATGSLTLLTQLYLERKGTFGSLIELSVSIGFIVGVSVGGGLQEVGGFVLPLLVFGGISLSLTLLLLVNVHPTECTSAKVPWRIVFKMFKSVWFVLIVLCAVISIVTSSSLSAFFGHFLSMHFGLRVGIIGVIYLSGLAVNTLATLSAGLIADKLKIPRYLLIGGLVVGFAGCVLIGPAMFITTPKLWLSIIAWMMFQTAIPFSCVPIYPAMYGVAKMLHVEEAVLASTVAGFVVASFSLGAFLGPIIGGVLVHQVGFPSMAAITGLTLLVHALVLVIATVIEKIWSRRMKAQK